MVQGTSTVVISASKGFSEKGSLSRLFKLADTQFDPETLQELLRPTLNKIYRNVLKNYHDLIRRSSLWLGAYTKIPGSKGAYQTGTLYNALQQDDLTTKKKGNKVVIEWGMSIASPADDPHMFERADRGWVNADSPNLGALFRWANIRFRWGLDSLANRKRNLLTALRQRTVTFGRQEMRADRALYILWKSVKTKRYKGLRLKKHLKQYTSSAVADLTRGGKLLSAKQIASLLTK